MFNTLTEKLNSAFHVLKGHGKITEINVAETLEELCLMLTLALRLQKNSPKE